MVNNIIKTSLVSLTLISSLNAIEKKNCFYGASVGVSQLSTSQNDISESIDLGTKPDTKGNNLTLEVGKRLSSDTFTTASYSYVNYSDIELHNYLVSYNGQNANGIYVGMVAGISNFKAKKSLMSGNIIDEGNAKLTLGFQAGYETKIDKKSTFFTQYQLLTVNHTVNLESSPAKSELNRNNFSNFNVGVRWSF